MLWTLVAVLLVLWLVGMIAGAFGGLIHLLLVLALAFVVISALQGRRAL
jgi:hypothetical protein